MIHTRYKLVPGYPHYRVGSDGTVWRRRFRGLNADDITEIKRLRQKGWTYKKIGKKFSRSISLIKHVCDHTGQFWFILKCNKNAFGYLSLNIDSKKRYIVHIHRLVLTAFKGPPPTTKHVCCHFPDRDPSNNRIENLRWGTQKENENDKRIHGTNPSGEKNSQAKLTNRQVIKIRRMYIKGIRPKEICKYFGVSKGAIRGIIDFNRWRHIPWPNRPV